LLETHRECHGPARLLDNLGDGYLYGHNPFFRRVRDAARARGFGYSAEGQDEYFGFPLIHLDTLLASRKVPYRRNYRALLHLERSRPGFFELSDLRLNRPTPNYLLHESAHAIAFHELFGRPRSVAEVLASPEGLLRSLIGEAFAMTSEYFAACAVEGKLHAWFFSINSYRHRTQAKKAIGELVDELGFAEVATLTLLALLCNNFLIDRLDKRLLSRCLELSPSSGTKLRPRTFEKLRRALASLMVMSPEFRLDTARLFLSMFGRPRSIRRVLSRDPLSLLSRDDRARSGLAVLTGVLEGTPRITAG
jgi:hypothetical protein